MFLMSLIDLHEDEKLCKILFVANVIFCIFAINANTKYSRERSCALSTAHPLFVFLIRAVL